MREQEIKKLPELVQDYLTYVRVNKGHSRLTVLEYASDLRTFFRFLYISRGLVSANAKEEEIDISKIDLDFIKSISLRDATQFLYYCANERSNNEATRAKKVISIRRFFVYLTDNRQLFKDNPMRALELPKTKKALPKYLTLEESKMLLNAVDGPNKERDYCIIMLFLNCGFRLSELVSINYNAIDANNMLTVLGKGNKERQIFLNDACMSAIRRYMAVRPVDGVKDKNALFLSSRGQRISPKTVQYIVHSYLEKAGLGARGLSVHKLRHTAATLMYQNADADLLVLKEILGHENLATTEIYTHLSSQQIKDTLKKNPLNDSKE